MARGKQLRSRFIESTTEVNHWIEDQQNSSTSDNLKESPNVGFLSHLFQVCLHVFMELSKYCRNVGRDRAQQIRVRNELANLVLWGDVCEEGKLESCLMKSQELHDSIVEALHGIGRTLNEGIYNTANIGHGGASQPLISARKDLEGLLEKAESMLSLQVGNEQFRLPSERFEAEKEENSRLRLESRLHNYVTCLINLAPTLQKVISEKDVSLEDPRNASDIAKFHVSQPAMQYVLRIVDKYKNAEHGLMERLGEANWQRYVRIQSQIQSTREGGSSTIPDLEARGPLAHLARSSYAASAASHTSFASTQSDAPGGRLRVPPTPPEVAQGLSFACYICGDVLTDVKNRIDWKVHIFCDIESYICTFGGCSESLIIFPTRKLWFEHELIKHRAKNVLECHECLRQFDTETDFLIHHEMDHSRYFNKLQLQATLSAARKYLPLVSEVQQCPLCLQSQWASQRKFVTHLGRHMEDIALASLPIDAASDSGAGSESESDVDSQISQRPGHSSLFGPTFSTAINDSDSHDEFWQFGVLHGQDEPLSSKTQSLRTKQVARGTYDSVLGPEKSRISKSDPNQGNSTRGRSSRTPKSAANAQKRIFTCAFSHYGCEATFGSKNEWKRHIGSRHLQLGFYRCDTGFCNPDAQSSSAKSHPSATKLYNDFNRKDLFVQHHRRMHGPWSSAKKEPSEKVKQEFEESLKEVQQRCWHERRAPPQRSSCGFCRRVFEGPTGWEDRMEHVGKHFEGKHNGVIDAEKLQEEEDEDLRDWAIREGIVQDYGARGFWLVGMEPAEAPAAGARSSRRRGKVRHDIQDEEDVDGEGENE